MYPTSRSGQQIPLLIRSLSSAYVDCSIARNLTEFVFFVSTTYMSIFILLTFPFLSLHFPSEQTVFSKFGTCEHISASS